MLLSFLAAEPNLDTYPQIKEQLLGRGLLDDAPRLAADLIDNLERLEQLAFLYEHLGRYTFTSECLCAWIKLKKPL